MLLREARLRKNLSQRALAKKAGLIQATISLAERGKVRPQPATRQKIEDILECKIEWPKIRPGFKRLEDEMSTDEFIEQEVIYALSRCFASREGDKYKKKIIKTIRHWLDFFEQNNLQDY